MKLSLIVSVYDRPKWLRLCLQSLILQTYADMEIIVTDNALDTQTAQKNQAVVTDVQACTDIPISYIKTSGQCYDAAEFAAKQALGEYLGFPSDDNWYAPDYCRKLMEAAEKGNLDLVFCDYLVAPRWRPEHTVVQCAPICGYIDKGGFFIRKAMFDSIGGFPGKINGPSASDGLLCQEAASRGTYGRVPEVMWFYG